LSAPGGCAIIVSIVSVKIFPFLIVILLSSAGYAQSLPHATRSFPMGQRGNLVFDYPRDWTNDLITLSEKGATNFAYFDAVLFCPIGTNNQCALQIELIPVSQLNADLKTLLATQGQQELTNAVENEIVVRELTPGQTNGWYFNVTDKRFSHSNPPTGEFKFLSQGYSEIGPLVLNFRFVANQESSRETALEIVRATKITPPDPNWTNLLKRTNPPPSTNNPAPIRIPLPANRSGSN